jgi:hypothetical protein
MSIFRVTVKPPMCFTYTFAYKAFLASNGSALLPGKSWQPGTVSSFTEGGALRDGELRFAENPGRRRVSP